MRGSTYRRYIRLYNSRWPPVGVCRSPVTAYCVASGCFSGAIFRVEVPCRRRSRRCVGDCGRWAEWRSCPWSGDWCLGLQVHRVASLAGSRRSCIRFWGNRPDGLFWHCRSLIVCWGGHLEGKKGENSNISDWFTKKSLMRSNIVCMTRTARV
jgi:hypothetical protein